MSSPGPGLLLVVSTPIGNLGDLSPRARQAFESADAVACEDTRRTGLLLHHLGIKRPLVSLHDHNERTRVPQLLERLSQGQTIALASDAGTPLVSDPGFLLVRAAIEQGARVEPIPGPSALLAALVVSGLPPHPFTFAGFPPPKSGKRRSFYRDLATVPHTLVFYESPHRLAASLVDAAEQLGPERRAVLGRELTKLHEEVSRATLEELASLAAKGTARGEYVLVVAGANPPNGAPRRQFGDDEPAP